MLILGVDPGKTTGWGQLRLEAKVLSPVNFGETSDSTCLELLPQIEESDLIVVENFLVRPGHARRGAFDYDAMIAPQVIGSLKTLLAQKSVQMHLQPASIKPVGYGFLGRKYVKGKKGQHKWDALAHAAYYAVKHLGASPVKKNAS